MLAGSLGGGCPRGGRVPEAAEGTCGGLGSPKLPIASDSNLLRIPEVKA